jgi:hypothetical protein
MKHYFLNTIKKISKDLMTLWLAINIEDSH